MASQSLLSNLRAPAWVFANATTVRSRLWTPAATGGGAFAVQLAETTRPSDGTVAPGRLATERLSAHRTTYIRKYVVLSAITRTFDAQDAESHPRGSAYPHTVTSSPLEHPHGGVTARVYPATIADAVDHELVIKKSRFITHIAPASSPEEAASIVARVRKDAWDTRHHCVARVSGLHGEHAGSSDDGEPSGTAGVPMLEVLRRRQLTDLVAIVTRYFGGAKLGAGGLIRAYSSAVSETLDRATLVQRELLRQAMIAVPHADAGRVENQLRSWATARGAVWSEPHYGEAVRFELWVSPADAQRLIDDIATASAGEYVPAFGAERVVDV